MMQSSTRISAAGGASASARPKAALDNDRLIARDGAALALRCWLPDAPRANLLALHGFNDYTNAFAAVGPALAQHGIATFAYDQRGFGRSPGRGRWPGADQMVEDALTAATLLRQRMPGLPLYLLGESMGGAVAILAANRGPATAVFDGIILLAPAVWGQTTMHPVTRLGLRLTRYTPALKWSQNLLPYTIRPSDNEAMLGALRNDPLVIKGTRSDTLHGLVALMGEALSAGPSFTAPALILYGANDQIVPRAPVARFVATLPPDAAAHQRVAYYPTGYHMLLRDIGGPLVTADILAWITDRAAALPSGADREGRARLVGEPPPRRLSALLKPWRPASF
jgi:acylglycerol lipase